jgi:6,7-dimethyl-8-ribityllumazine synthase
MSVFEGHFSAPGVRLAVVAARFNHFVTERLVEGAIDAYVRHGGAKEDLDIMWVPGSWETPLAASWAAETGRYDAIVALGCVVRGATAHFDYVAGAAASGLREAQSRFAIPVVFGILTTDTVEQAVDRAGAKQGNKGFDAVLTALEMVDLKRKVSGA